MIDSSLWTETEDGSGLWQFDTGPYEASVRRDKPDEYSWCAWTVGFGPVTGVCETFAEASAAAARELLVMHAAYGKQLAKLDPGCNS
jgi:hypothetical protein